MSDIVLVTVSGDSFKTALMRRISELEVEAEAERKDIEERKRKRLAQWEEETAKRERECAENLRLLTEWNSLSWLERIGTPRPEGPTTFFRWPKPHILYLYPKQQHLDELKSYLPCPNGSIQISLTLAQELGLV